MKILIYSPYFPDHTGGGEKYLLDVARVLLELDESNQVVIGLGGGRDFSESELGKVREKYEQFLGENLDQRIKFEQVPLGSGSFLSNLIWSRQWDVIYYATDGSFFFSLAKKNILHIQIPFLNKLGLMGRLKLGNWQIKNANSEFTKKVVEKSWLTEIDMVHYPTWVEEHQIDLKKKEKVVLNVGRFFSHLHSKRQDILVEMWAQLLQKSPLAKNWKLVLIGAVEDEEYLQKVKEVIKTHKLQKQVIIKNDVSRKELLEWYQKASIYWHATGFGVDQEQHPEKVEHFGITTLEAMSYGCVPVVINKGGQPEVVGKELKDLLWDDLAEAVNQTAKLIEKSSYLSKISKKSVVQALKFSKSKFVEKLSLMCKQ
jgi:glycosyltransferase involved in cell wall biosynthesis